MSVLFHPPFTIYRPKAEFATAISLSSADKHLQESAQLLSTPGFDLADAEKALTILRNEGLYVPVGFTSLPFEDLVEGTNQVDLAKNKQVKLVVKKDVSLHPTQQGDVFLDNNGRFIIVNNGQACPFPRSNRQKTGAQSTAEKTEGGV